MEFPRGHRVNNDKKKCFNAYNMIFNVFGSEKNKTCESGVIYNKTRGQKILILIFPDRGHALNVFILHFTNIKMISQSDKNNPEIISFVLTNIYPELLIFS